MILVTGGTGALGSRVVQRLIGRGHEVRVMSRRAGADPSRVLGDLESGEGLRSAVSGVDAIVHAASSPYRRTALVDVEGTRKLLAAAREAGVGHVLYPSIVGCDAIPLAYYRCKADAERVIEAGGVGHTILRATQFHTLLDESLRWCDRWPLIVLPKAFRFQLVDPGRVADRIADLIDGAPAGRVRDVAGPAVQSLGEIADIWLAGRRRVWNLPTLGGLARAFKEGRNTSAEAEILPGSWAEWLGRS